MPNDLVPDADVPAPVPLYTLADFHAAGLLALLADHQHACCDDLEPVLRQAGAARTDAPGQALIMLAEICSMMLVPEQPDQVYRPMMIWADGRCTMGPEHLTGDQLDVLAELVHAIEQPALRARLADLVWLRNRRRGVQYPRMAIEAYRRRPADFLTWFTGANGDGVGWHRALQLTKMIGARDDEDAITRTLLEAFFRATDDRDAYAPLAFIKPLWIERRAAGRELDVAGRLEALGHDHFAAALAFDAESCFAAAADWYRWAKKDDAHADMKAMVARAIVLQAEQGDGAIVQHHWLTKAIEAYRQVPGAAFDRLGVDAAIEALRRQRDVAGRAALGEMRTFKLAVPAGEVRAWAIEQVQGKNPLMALCSFCGFVGIDDAATLRAEAERSFRQHPLAAIIGGAVLAGDGRQVANKGPDAGRGAQVAEKTRELFRMHAQFTVVSALVPALDQIRNEHAYRLVDFVAIAERSPAVPVGRANIVGQGLHAGFAGDMVQAIHILLPQFENIVRHVLQGADAFTAEHRRDGLDMEVGLSSLIERPQMTELFGDDFKLAVHALMCDPAGANLRNAVAHGQADEGLCASPAAFYAWWLILQLVVETFASTQAGVAEAEAR